jgi:hypothetical protein
VPDLEAHRTVFDRGCHALAGFVRLVGGCLLARFQDLCLRLLATLLSSLRVRRLSSAGCQALCDLLQDVQRKGHLTARFHLRENPFVADARWAVR